MTGTLHVSINLSSNKIQNEDILVLANPSPPGKWPLKWRETETETERQREIKNFMNTRYQLDGTVLSQVHNEHTAGGGGACSVTIMSLTAY